MNPKPELKKCGFKGCHMMVPVTLQVCDDCCFKLHVMIREKQGFTRHEATIEYQREQGPSLN